MPLSAFRPVMAAVASAAILCGALTGCAMPGSNNGLYVDASDPCGRERQELSLSNDYFTQQIAVRAATGALIGGLGGGLIGGLAGGGRGAATGAIAGALTGLAVGAASGYFDQLRQNNADQRVLAMQVNDDLTTEVRQIDRTAASFATLRACRFAQARRIKYDTQTGRMSRPEALAQLDRQRAFFAEEVAAAQRVGLNMRSRDEQFAYAAQSISGPAYPTYNNQPTRAPTRTASRAVPRASADPATNAAILAAETVPQKRNSFETTVSAASTQSKTAFDLDSGAISQRHPLPLDDGPLAPA